MTTANLIEIFSSLQGEGPYIGEPMIFVRFQDCALSCRYCDTPDSFKKLPNFRMENPPGSGCFEERPNPLRPDELTGALHLFQGTTLSLTGGEPLQHGSFLEAWLPELKGSYRILLETNGVLVQELKKVLPYLDIISMDMKLPSVTGMKNFWAEHIEFLKLAREREVYVKVVVSAPTDLQELERALAIVEKYAPGAPFILQPVTPAGGVQETISEDRLIQLYQFSKRTLKDVRVIPQVHAHLGFL